MSTAVVVPYVTELELEQFKAAWSIGAIPRWLIFQRDEYREGCGATKNRGILNAVRCGFDTVVILDGDCFPYETKTLEQLIERHEAALLPSPVKAFVEVTHPPSRGTPFHDLTMLRPVAASMGFWEGVPDYDAVRQLAFRGASMTFDERCIYGQYFPLCGMNLAFRPRDWWPWCQFVDVSRYDDIWMGWLWQREAYRRGYCFNLAGPKIFHQRQSNVWRNLIDEARYAQESETLWRVIAGHRSDSYSDLIQLLPTGTKNLELDRIDHALADRR